MLMHVNDLLYMYLAHHELESVLVIVIISNLLYFAGAGPKRLRTILEGESLLNDASSITLFVVFLEQVQSYEAGITAESGGKVLGTIVKNIVVLAVGESSTTACSVCIQQTPTATLHALLKRCLVAAAFRRMVHHYSLVLHSAHIQTHKSHCTLPVVFHT